MKIRCFPSTVAHESQIDIETAGSVDCQRPVQFAHDKIMAQPFAPVFTGGNVTGQVVLVNGNECLPGIAAALAAIITSPRRRYRSPSASRVALIRAPGIRLLMAAMRSPMSSRNSARL